MLIQNNLISEAKFIASPNYNDRPAGMAIDLLVIHGISLPPGQFGGDEVQGLFTNTLDTQAHPDLQEVAQLRVSSHLFIRRNGSIIQFVPFNKRAWHAGVSCFEGRDNCNDFSIGIELEGTDTIPYEAVQYQQLAEVTLALLNAYPGITLERIVGHSTIAPGRKTDPGPAFDWDSFKLLMRTNKL